MNLSVGAAGLALCLSLVGCAGDEEPGSPSARPGPAAVREARTPRDVLLITLDTTRADRLGFAGNPSVRTPNLDALAAESTIFDRAYTAVPSTLPSHCSIMTGLYPQQHGVHDNGRYYLDSAHRTLAECLTDHGWNTAGFTGAFVLDRQFQIDQGFDIYDDQMQDPLNDETDVRRLPSAMPEGLKRWFAQLATSYQRRAEAVTSRVGEWLDTELDERPFFLWVHYFDPHEPYDAPGEYERMFDPSYQGAADGTAAAFGRELQRLEREHGPGFSQGMLDREVRHMIARYDGEVSYMDHWIGRLRAQLEELGRWEDTLVIVVADHGEGFGEHAQIWEHKGSVHDEVTRVPLTVRLPGGRPDVARSDRLVRTIDLMPTILDVVGVDDRPRMEGRSLIPLLVDDEAPGPGAALLEAGRFVQISPTGPQRLAIRDGSGMTVMQLDARGALRQVERYESTGRGRPESGGVIPPGPEANQRADEVAQAFRQLEGTPQDLPLRPLDALASDALEALGYLESDDLRRPR